MIEASRFYNIPAPGKCSVATQQFIHKNFLPLITPVHDTSHTQLFTFLSFSITLPLFLGFYILLLGKDIAKGYKSEWVCVLSLGYDHDHGSGTTTLLLHNSIGNQCHINRRPQQLHLILQPHHQTLHHSHQASNTNPCGRGGRWWRWWVKPNFINVGPQVPRPSGSHLLFGWVFVFTPSDLHQAENRGPGPNRMVFDSTFGYWPHSPWLCTVP